MVRVKEISRDVHVGSEHGKWKVIGPPFSIGQSWDYQAVCKCRCGVLAVVTVRNLSGGQSLGCRACSNRKYRCHNKRIKSIWNGMYSRCYRTYDVGYERYGARGIRICKEWLESIDAFADWATQNGYAEHLELDRIDNDGNYEPDNCRWVTRDKNSSNRRTSRHVSGFGETKTVAEWAKDSRCVVKYQTLQSRLNQGRSLEHAITEPAR